jgi:hypothetical protein
MKLTKQSKILLDFLKENGCEQTPNLQIKKTDPIIKKFFLELEKANAVLQQKKKANGSFFYNFSIQKLSTVQDIKRPKQFNANSFPEEVRTHIDENSAYNLSYTFSLFEREVVVHFIVEDSDAELHIERYNQYVEKIFLWLYFVRDYESRSCAKHLTLYLYLTSLTKALPESEIHILDEIHVNTGFTYTCPTISEIVVFRKEEWFKVLLHESFHNFGLDFSDMNTSECNKKILSIFPVESEVNLFESYTEFWAELINALFCSFFASREKAIDECLENFHAIMFYEQSYSFFQLVKALRFMGLTYKDLYSSDSHIERETLYRENSNVLSYYVIKTILLSDYPSFLIWAKKNNLSLLQFKKTPGNIREFCLYIEKNYKKKSMLEGIRCAEELHLELNTTKYNKTKYSKTKYSKKMQFIWNNMRMTICEMD